ncbi:MAG TPA: YciC family protein [Candidatus Sulfotelmatobacter sp.]|nr:YciC family protein [Candidatus Sulfotelmatobacter sp.]
MEQKKSSKTPNFVKKEAIKFGFEVAKKNVVFFLGVFVIWAIVTFISSAIQGSLNANKQFLVSFLFSLFMWVVNAVISMGIINITLMLVDKKKPKLQDIYYKKKIFNYILASIIRGVILVVGFLLLIIPGIIFAIKLQYSEYLIVDKGYDAVDSIKGSWEMTKGVKWNLFLFGLLLGLINILGFLCLLVGLLITVPLSMVANAYVYRKLLSQSGLK